MSSIKEATISGVKWTAIERFSVQIVNFLLGLLLARLLSPSDFGTIGMIGIFMAISQTFIDSGFSTALIRKQDITDKDYSTAFYFNALAGLFFYALLFFCSPLIACYFKTPELSSIVKVYSSVLFINSLTAAQDAKLNHEMNFKLQAKVGLICALAGGVLGVILAYLGYGVWALVWQAIFTAVLRMILLWTLSQWFPHSRFSKESFKYLFSFGSKLLLSGILHTVYTNLSSFAIGRRYTSEDLGYYSRGSQFANLPTSTISGILGKVTFPLFSTIQDDDTRLISVYRKYICITSLGIFFFSMLMAALAKPLIVIMLTDKWADAAIYLQLFCFASMFDHICKLNLNLLQVKGRSDLFLKLEIIKKSISIIMLLCAIPLGVIAICISSVIYTQIAVYINTYYTGKLFKLGYLEQIKDFGKYFLLSALACLPALCLTFLGINNFVVLISGCIISCGLYYLFLHRDEYMRELITIASSYFSKFA